MKTYNKSTIIKILSIFAVVALLVATFIIAKSKSGYQTYVKDGYFFDTYVSFTVYSPKDAEYLDGCEEICRKYQNLFDKNTEGSDIYRINNAGTEPVKVDPETYKLISDAYMFSEETQGKIDMTVENLVLLWGFEDKSVTASLPTDKELDEALALTDYRKIVLSDNCTIIKTDKNVKIDPGFIAKGYIADRIAEYLKENGVESAIINLGGNILCVGSRPNGEAFNIGIKDPNDTSTIIETLNVSNKSVVTSGTYERYVTINNIKYHHILDSRTGYPAETSVQSVTIICDSSEYGDALSTACLILGEKNSRELLQKYNAEAIFK